MLLFVIRDKSKTPLSKLVEVLSEDVHKMWDTISKPPQYVDSKIDDFFEVGAKQSQHTSTGVLYWPGRPQLLLTAQQLGRYSPTRQLHKKFRQIVGRGMLAGGVWR